MFQIPEGLWSLTYMYVKESVPNLPFWILFFFLLPQLLAVVRAKQSAAVKHYQRVIIEYVETSLIHSYGPKFC